MPLDFHSWAERVRRLDRALVALEPEAARVGVSPPAGEPWYELLAHKLRPQLEAEPLLVVAVVGGTNIGKSLIFNHLAGEMASGVSPLAAGTKHPVCLVPPGFADTELLARMFEGFELDPWHSAEDPLEASDTHRLFWRTGQHVPDRLLLLDTPDIDSDAVVNWQRAAYIRQASDVLVVILTQQKYNDAAVKQFLREAVRADKAIVLVFNQVDLAGDQDVWPHWLGTVREATGGSAEHVYVAPYDREAARQLALPFYEVGADGRGAVGAPSSLRSDLASLHFDAIKIRTFRGALAEVLDPAHGAPAYLARIRQGAGEFSAAATALSAAEMARVQWPSLPIGIFVDEIRTWWDSHRSGWSRAVHGVYHTIGEGLSWPVRVAWRQLASDTTDPLETFRHNERDAVVLAVEKLIGELERLAEVGNDTLRPRLKPLLRGEARSELLARVEAAHAALPPIDDDYRAFLRAELDQWSLDNPRAVSFLRSFDHVMAVARPAITVSLAVSGWIVAGGIVHDAAVQAAGHTASQLATEAAITGGITGGGELLVNTTGEGVRRTAARLFRRLQTGYAQRRAAWLAGWLERELLGDLLADLRRGAETPQSAAYQEATAAVAGLQSLSA
ncbi:MAG: GTPase domain-containing protein [Pirellulales bacterium]|nr:GTPase domain-containing protein [Pirellulales bacterium]